MNPTFWNQQSGLGSRTLSIWTKAAQQPWLCFPASLKDEAPKSGCGPEPGRGFTRNVQRVVDVGVALMVWACLSHRCCEWLRCCGGGEPRPRTVWLGHPEKRDQRYPRNVINNQKYNFFTFLPGVRAGREPPRFCPHTRCVQWGGSEKAEARVNSVCFPRCPGAWRFMGSGPQLLQGAGRCPRGCDTPPAQSEKLHGGLVGGA